MPETRGPKIVLIGGVSHVGKSTLCAALGARSGWNSMSTDMLGRHPGRPWRQSDRTVPQHVANHYLSLSTEELVEDLLRHQRRMWPTIERIITHRMAANAAPKLAFEGSALLPENAGTVNDERVSYLCLTAAPDFLQQRIHESSSYESATPEEQSLIDKFIDRNRLLNALYVDMARANGAAVIDVGLGISIDELVEMSLK